VSVREFITTSAKIQPIVGPPGVGKTFFSLDRAFLNAQSGKVTVLFYSDHELMENDIIPLAKKFQKKCPTNINFCHWKGQAHKCTHLRTQTNYSSLFKKLHQFIHGKELCVLCHSIDRKTYRKCPYRKQFKTKAKIIIAPQEYLGTKYVENLKPHTIVLDELCLKKNVFRRPDINPLTRLWNKCFPTHRILPGDLEQQLKNYKIAGTLNHTLTRLRNRIERKLLHVALKDRNGPLRQSYINIIQLKRLIWEAEEYYRYAKIFNIELLAFGKPLLLEAFKYSNMGIEVFLVDATYSSEFMEDMIERFKLEHPNSPNPRIEPPKIMKPTADHGSVIYHVVNYHKKGIYPRVSVEHPKTKQNISNYILHFLQRWNIDPNAPPDTLGYVTFQKRVKKKTKSGKYYSIGNGNTLSFPSLRNCHKSLYYGNLRSKNTLQHCKYGFVIGSHYTRHLLWDYNLFYPHHYLKNEPEHIRDKDGRFRYPSHRHFNTFYLLHGEAEVYHAIHRFRPLRHKTEIVLIGAVPEMLKTDGTDIKIVDVELDNTGKVTVNETYRITMELLRQQPDRFVLKDVVLQLMQKCGLKNYDSTFSFVKRACKILGYQAGYQLDKYSGKIQVVINK